MLSKSEFVARMKRIAEDSKDDPEFNHLEADLLLCAFIESVGFPELAAEWKKVNKWFA